jgi:hypothetical protein
METEGADSDTGTRTRIRTGTVLAAAAAGYRDAERGPVLYRSEGLRLVASARRIRNYM